ncbi:DUF481 domain-containing protein [Archangium lipolyticum]|uniref:DUF481 domain-containing protein n=1 Tax=Archangium lipolyticum TaxID=2970465 RepID=UPI00214A2701|nr:DUF481 domain-containing protein [Archangium lipolyticum]
MLSFVLSLALAAQDPSPVSNDSLMAAQEPPTSDSTGTEEQAELSSEEAPAGRWEGTAGAGFSWFTGNSESFTLTGLVEARRSWSPWAVGLRLEGAYGRARPAGDTSVPSSVVAERLGLQLRGDRDLTPRLSVYLLTGGDIDRVRSVQLRTSGEAGAGYVWLERLEEDYTRLRLETDVGMRYIREARYQYYPELQDGDPDLNDVNFLGPRLAGAFRWGFSKNVWLLEELEAMPNLLGDNRLLVRNTARLSSGLTESLALSTTFVLEYDSAPAAPIKTDTALVLRLDARF